MCPCALAGLRADQPFPVPDGLGLDLHRFDRPIDRLSSGPELGRGSSSPIVGNLNAESAGRLRWYRLDHLAGSDVGDDGGPRCPGDRHDRTNRHAGVVQLEHHLATLVMGESERSNSAVQ